MTHKPLVALCAILGAIIGSSLVLSCSSDNGKKKGDTSGTAGQPSVDMTIGEPNDAGIVETITGNGGEAEMTADEYSDAMESACKNKDSITASAVNSKLELVVDASSSMDEIATGNSVTKWEATRDALLEAIVGVNGSGLGSSMGVGLLLYPNMEGSSGGGDVSACVNTAAMVPMAPLGDASGAQRQAIRAALEAQRQGSGTPTHDAYQYGLTVGMLQQGASIEGNGYMLLITDGQPTRDLGCVSGSATPPIVQAVADAYQQGVKTFVIGSPGSEDGREWLSEAALAGGTAYPDCSAAAGDCHMDMTTAPNFSEALQAGLAEITGQMADCTYAIPAPPEGQVINLEELKVFVTDPSSGNVTLLYPDATPDDCTVGWQYTKGSNQIVLCPDSCAAAQSTVGAKVDLAFGCTAGTTDFPPPK
jgi:hypothetical protein